MAKKLETEADRSTRDRLLQAGLEEFAQKGFDGATVRSISRRAEANLNSIKYHFGDKWEFYKAVLNLCEEQFGDPVLPVVPDDAPPLEQLQAFVLEMVTFAFSHRAKSKNPLAMQLISRELQSPTGGLRLGPKVYVLPIWELLTSIMSKLLPRDVDDADLHLLCLSVMGQINHYHFGRAIVEYLLPEDERAALTIDRVANHIVRVTQAAVETFHSSPCIARRNGTHG